MNCDVACPMSSESDASGVTSSWRHVQRSAYTAPGSAAAKRPRSRVEQHAVCRKERSQRTVRLVRAFVNASSTWKEVAWDADRFLRTFNSIWENLDSEEDDGGEAERMDPPRLQEEKELGRKGVSVAPPIQPV